MDATSPRHSPTSSVSHLSSSKHTMRESASGDLKTVDEKVIDVTPSTSPIAPRANGPFDTDVSSFLAQPQRKPVKATFFGAVSTIIKVIFSLALVVALGVGYGLHIEVFSVKVTSVGLYGTILIADFVVQYTCAIFNRYDVSRIINNVKAIQRRKACDPNDYLANQASSPRSSVIDKEKLAAEVAAADTMLMNPNAEISIAVVGYREDEQAWKECLRSLQKQTLAPKCVVGVVDGNEQPDLDMANAFMEEFEEYKSALIHLPTLLSALHRKTYFDTLAAQTPADKRGRVRKFFDGFRGHHIEGEMAALQAALEAVMAQVAEWEAQYKISSYEAVCFSQPHSHKRTAMFTAFAMSLYALKTRHAIFTTDSDTLVKEDALDEMLTLLHSSSDIGGVTADVKIWNRKESFLARLCSIRYWFAFNIERACQSWWRCVGCLSGPMSMYRSQDLHTILGLWNLQTFRGKDTTFGDDRHLSNQILAQGLKTRYTHRTWCESESPTTFVRWIVQQSRWSKSFFREAFWFPHAFAKQSWWMLVEITKQSMYPFILVATVFHFLYAPSDAWRPVIWIATMVGVALVKSLLAFAMSRDPWLLLFTFYGVIYFFGLLPSKLYALLTMNKTTWGTSARSSTERKRGQTFFQRLFHVGHLVLWYTATAVGLGFFFAQVFDNNLYFLIGFAAVIPSALLFWQLPSPSGAVRALAKKFKGSEEAETTTRTTAATSSGDGSPSATTAASATTQPAAGSECRQVGRAAAPSLMTARSDSYLTDKDQMILPLTASTPVRPMRPAPVFVGRDSYGSTPPLSPASTKFDGPSSVASTPRKEVPGMAWQNTVPQLGYERTSQQSYYYSHSHAGSRSTSAHSGRSTPRSEVVPPVPMLPYLNDGVRVDRRARKPEQEAKEEEEEEEEDKSGYKTPEAR